MAYGYRIVDRDRLFLLPPDVRAWLPEGHLAWFVLDVIERIDTSALHEAHPNDGVGRRAYDPEMLLALLLYAYCTGQRSSRRIEQLCEVDVAFRVICANDAPDHTTIARFRQHHQQQAAALFVEVLLLCKQAGLTKVGVVAVDGTKIAADASLKANRSEAWLEAEVAKMMAEAEAVDAVEDEQFGDGRGDGLPAELARRESRRRRLDAALEQLRAKRAQRDAKQAQRDARVQRAMVEGRGLPRRWRSNDPVADAEMRVEYHRRRAELRRAEIDARAAARGQRPRGFTPRQDYNVTKALQRLDDARAQTASHESTATSPAEPSKPDKANITDPDSRVMPTAKGWVQGFNAQAAVNEAGVVVAADVTNDVNDTAQCQPMTDATVTNLSLIGVDDPVGTLLFDAGYFSDDNATADGPDRLIATKKSFKLRQQMNDKGPTTGPPPDNATPTEAMEHRLRTRQGADLYAKRQHTVEPVFGHVKEGRGIRRFSRRGLDAVRAEWQLITATHNLLKLASTRIGPT